MILKICGITNQVDATAAMDGGATALGFNFCPGSPRYLAPEEAAGIVTAGGVRRVGIFVNETGERVEEIARTARLDVAQLHGDETPADYPNLPVLTVWKALRPDDSFHIAAYRDLPVEALLLDGPAGSLYGGAGRSFDWRLVGETDRKIVLAGGLDAANVAAAIEIVRPWGVDACSRIESAPGKKDHRKMNQFLQAAMAAARS
jgi:phosphoribosylanthranilate isomerase